MFRRHPTRALIVLVSAFVFGGVLHGQGAPPAVPKDLKPLLTPRQSEMRLVTARYTLDRTTLSGNCFGGGGRGGRGSGIPGRARAGGGRRAARGPDRVVHVLQRLRPAVHLVDSGLMDQKAFHDEVLRQGSQPIALLRLSLSRQTLTRDMSVDWRFR